MNYLRIYWQQMLEAVFVVHSEDERIVHGDIKPQNFVFVKGIRNCLVVELDWVQFQFLIR